MMLVFPRQLESQIYLDSGCGSPADLFCTCQIDNPDKTWQQRCNLVGIPGDMPKHLSADSFQRAKTKRNASSIRSQARSIRKGFWYEDWP